MQKREWRVVSGRGSVAYLEARGADFWIRG